MSQRFLAIDMFSGLHGGHGDGGVHVVGCGNDDGIESAGEVSEEFAVVVPVSDAGVCGIGFVEAAVIDIAEADEFDGGVFANIGEVGPAHAIDADGGDVEFFFAVWGGEDGGCGGGGGNE
ncbi:MAG: hypothetical protein RL215_497 [Planctomycetota bacterium]